MIDRYSDVGKQRHCSVARGFTIVELIAVMAILAAVATIAGSLFFSGSSPSLRMQAGVAEAGALFNQARALAQARHAPVRVLISRDDDDPKKNGRYMVVTVLEDSELKQPDEPLRWQPAGNGIYLPQGIFHAPLSEHILRWDPVSRLDDETNGQPWTSYSFGSSGHGRGGPFLLIAGARPPDGGMTMTDVASIDGFLIRRNGSLTFFENADQVKQFLEQRKK